MSRNKQLKLDRPLGEINRRLADKIESATTVLNTRRNPFEELDFNSIHHDARENQLDSLFLLRKKKLLDICKENKHIFEKIYTQKTAYSKHQFDEAYRTTKQISLRMLKTKERLRERLWDDPPEMQATRRMSQTKNTQRSIKQSRLPSLEQKSVNFFNEIYDLPHVETIACRTTISSSRSSRENKDSRLFKIKDFIMF